jgi:hypothetical protein
MTMRAARLALIGAMVALSACAPSESGDETTPVRRLPSDLGYSELAWGIENSCNGAQPALIRNDADWQAFWTAVRPDEPVPAVDFSTDSVLAACVYIGDPGHRYAIAGWEENAPRQLTVHTTVATPACGPSPQIVVAGYHAIRIDGTFDSAEFQERSAVRESCDLPDDRFGWETLAYGQYSGCTEPTDVVIGTAEDWTAFWSSLHANVDPEPARPAVDFASESVIATCLGERPDGGYVTYFRYVGEPDETGHVILDGVERVSGPTCAVSAAVTQPYHVIRLNRVATGATVRRLTLESACS